MILKHFSSDKDMSANIDDSDSSSGDKDMFVNLDKNMPTDKMLFLI